MRRRLGEAPTWSPSDSRSPPCTRRSGEPIVGSDGRPWAPSYCAACDGCLIPCEPSMSRPKTSSSTTERLEMPRLEMPVRLFSAREAVSMEALPAAPSRCASLSTGGASSEPSRSRPKMIVSTLDRMLGCGACGGGGTAATLITRESQPAAPSKAAEAPSGTLSSEPSMSRPKTTLSTSERWETELPAGRPLPAPNCMASAAPSRAASSAAPTSASDPSMSWPKTTRSTLERMHGGLPSGRPRVPGDFSGLPAAPENWREASMGSARDGASAWPAAAAPPARAPSATRSPARRGRQSPSRRLRGCAARAAPRAVRRPDPSPPAPRRPAWGSVRRSAAALSTVHGGSTARPHARPRQLRRPLSDHAAHTLQARARLQRPHSRWRPGRRPRSHLSASVPPSPAPRAFAGPRRSRRSRAGLCAEGRPWRRHWTAAPGARPGDTDAQPGSRAHRVVWP
eukprot:scaffold58946_cov63-Phaeocystis_antarctica.AAC.3